MPVLRQNSAESRAGHLECIRIRNRITPVKRVRKRPAHILTVINRDAAVLVDVAAKEILAALFYVLDIVNPDFVLCRDRRENLFHRLRIISCF